MLQHPLFQHPLLQHPISKAALLLAGFAFIGAVSLAAINALTQPKIAQNERLATLTRLNALVAPERYDNDLVSDQTQLNATDFGSSEAVTVYRARKQNQPVATIFQVTAPDGYSGNIRLLVGVNSDQSLAGVRVLAHKETPGLGDKIEIEKADWIKQFTGKSLINPSESQWAVKKDGGEFDQFSGATITPRAVVNQTKRVLVWAQSHLNEAFNAPAQEQQP